MKTKVSKTLDSLFARTTFDLLKSDIRHSYKDHLAAELLRNDTTMAYNILSLMLHRDEIFWMTTHIMLQAERNPCAERLPIDMYLLGYRKYLQEKFAPYSSLSTIHLLLDICVDTESATSRTFARFGISHSSIEKVISGISNNR